LVRYRQSVGLGDGSKLKARKRAGSDVRGRVDFLAFATEVAEQGPNVASSGESSGPDPVDRGRPDFDGRARTWETLTRKGLRKVWT
jgi:hypothetical protein